MDESDPNYQEGIEINKQECKNIVDILEKDPATRDFRALMKIYIPRTTGVGGEDKPYLDSMEALIHDLLTASPMWQPVFKQPQTSDQILATTYSGFYNTPTNKEFNGIIADDSTVDFNGHKAEEKHLFDFVGNMCSPQCLKL